MEFAKHVKIREEKFGVAIFDTLREKVFVTNKQGADILRLLRNGKSREEIVEALVNEYDGGRETIRNDVTSFIDNLVENRLLVKDG
ncbi:MAG: PqqD family protein [Candidatus Hadarchaeaceae archaeon]